MLNLTNENYFSRENNKLRMSASQFKGFHFECQAQTLAEINGEWEREKTSALLVGSYVDAHFEKTLDLFKAKNPEIFTKTGGLKSEYRKAEEIINRIERDEFFMSHMRGDNQTVMTGEIGGVQFKIKMDVYVADKHIIDLKIMRDFKDIYQGGIYLPFVEAWHYDIQGAIYQEIVRQNDGEKLPFIIAGATKEKETDIELLSVGQNRLDFCLEIVEQCAPLYANIKLNLIEAERCSKCDFCKSQKKLFEVIDYRNYKEL